MGKKLMQWFMFSIFRLLSLMVVFILFSIIGFVAYKGLQVISIDFLIGMPENGMSSGGILPAIVGTLCLTLGSLIIAFPIGLLSGIYVSEFARDNWLKRIIQIMTNNLAGVPSIIFGLFGMALFVNQLGFGDSILAGSLTLAVLVLPIIIRITEESLQTIDPTIRQASFALGASRWQTAYRALLPIALPDIITGLIISMGRVSGETAPILFTVAAYYLPKLPSSIFDQVMAMPYHLYVLSTSGTDPEASRGMAYGTALILILLVLLLNLLAGVARRRLSKNTNANQL
jgi:phosphate transport system permease protein